jgi:signal transduction histidine kinase
MSTGSLRTRVAVVSLSLLAFVLIVVVAAVTLAYRSSLEGDLRHRLETAGSAVRQARSAAAVKPLTQGLALEGIATSIDGPQPLPAGKAVSGATAPVKTGSSIHTRGSLFVLDEILRDGTRVSFSARAAGLSSSVDRLLLVEVLVALGAFALAAMIVIRGTTTALRPLTQVAETATRIAGGDRRQRLRPTRTDTELGRMAGAFDRMVDALEAAVDRAQEHDAATRRFLADASHELRTPIAALQASAETLLREQPERPDRDRLEAAVARDAARLGRLVDDLLGLARLEARTAFASVELSTIIRSAAADARRAASETEIALDLDDGLTVDGDRDSLGRLLRNLLDNALAASRPGGHVAIDLRRRDGHAHARVTDDGPGVPAAERERVFERFVRLDRTTPGSGLGLSIARRIAREHGGDLTCDPSTRGGTFTLRLPLKTPLALE